MAPSLLTMWCLNSPTTFPYLYSWGKNHLYSLIWYHLVFRRQEPSIYVLISLLYFSYYSETEQYHLVVGLWKHKLVSQNNSKSQRFSNKVIHTIHYAFFKEIIIKINITLKKISRKTFRTIFQVFKFPGICGSIWKHFRMELYLTQGG